MICRLFTVSYFFHKIVRIKRLPLRVTLLVSTVLRLAWGWVSTVLRGWGTLWESFENNACRKSGKNQHFKQFYILSPQRNAKKSLLYLTPIRHHQFLLQFCWPKMIQNSRKVKQTGFLKVFIEMMTFQWLVSVGNLKPNALSMHISIHCLMPNQMPPSLPEQHAPLSDNVTVNLFFLPPY